MMSWFLFRLGSATAARPWRVVVAWVGALALAIGLSLIAGGDPHDDYDAPGTASQRGTDLLRAEFPALAETDARVVVHDPDGRSLDGALLATVADNLRGAPDVSFVAPPQLSGDGDTALITVKYTKPVTDVEPTEVMDSIYGAARPAVKAGLHVEVGGQIAENISRISGIAEVIGVTVALVILLFAFGSIVAAGVPIAVALVALGIGSSGIALIAATTNVSTIAPTLGTMVGLGVGIDYALLLVTRHVEGLRAGLSVREAAGHATATAGTSVLFAGVTVILSLMGLRLVGLSSYSSTGFTTATVVVTVIATSLTLVPALCGLAGYRLFGRKARKELATTPDGSTPTGPSPATTAPVAARPTLTARWATKIGRRPLPWAIGAFLLLLLLAAPVLGMRTWPQDASSQPTSTYQRRAYDLVAAEYGPGANGPLMLAVDLRRVSEPELTALIGEITKRPDVASVSPPAISPSGNAAVVIVTPTVAPSDPAATALVRSLREDVVPPGVEITGLTAVFIDLSDWLADRLWLVVGFVVTMSLLLLTVVFRSPVVAAKAAVMNILSIAAAYGVVTVVFQWGWGTGLLGLPHAIPMSSWLPVLMFAILFGLSMDYEVFLLSRIREDWLATGDARGSVVRGLSATGRVITSAALIMIAVFAGFALDPDVTVKMVGVGMAVAVLVDATIIRMVLVPATMTLLGDANWWLPAWLDRVLPHLNVHGDAAAPSQSDTLAAAGRAAVASGAVASAGASADAVADGSAGADESAGATPVAAVAPRLPTQPATVNHADEAPIANLNQRETPGSQ